MPELWAITAEALARLGSPAYRAAPARDLLPRPAPPGGRSEGVQVIPIVGPLSHRRSWWGTSLDAIAAEVTAAAAAGRAIVLDVDSPGGEVRGTPEAAAAIAAAARRVPVVAAVTQAASAAYWLASGATSIVVSPSGEVGAIGVLLAHFDLSRRLEAEGVAPTLLHIPRHKGEGHPYAPLSEETQAAWQRDLERIYGQFTAAVARGRRVPLATVTGPAFGEGRVLDAEAAVRVGAADGIGTLPEVVAALAAGHGPPLRPSVSAHAARLRLLQLESPHSRTP